MAGLAILMITALTVLAALFTTLLVYEMRHPPRHTAAYALARKLPCDPGERGLKFEEWLLDLKDGGSLPVWDISNQQATRNVPLTAVFIHGWGHSRVDALTRIEPFLTHCARTVFYDLRGHGESKNCLSRLGHGEEQDLLQLLERLETERYLLVGHSMGAVIAIAAAVSNSSIAKRIAGIIAYGPYCEFHPSLCGRLRVAGLPTRPVTNLAMFVHRVSGFIPRSLREDELSQLQSSLLIVHGTEDMVAPIAHGRRIARAAPHATLQEVEGGGHVDAHLVNPQEHVRVIGEFVERLC